MKSLSDIFYDSDDIAIVNLSGVIIYPARVTKGYAISRAVRSDSTRKNVDGSTENGLYLRFRLVHSDVGRNVQRPLHSDLPVRNNLRVLKYMIFKMSRI